MTAKEVEHFLIETGFKYIPDHTFKPMWLYESRLGSMNIFDAWIEDEPDKIYQFVIQELAFKQRVYDICERFKWKDY